MMRTTLQKYGSGYKTTISEWFSYQNIFQITYRFNILDAPKVAQNPMKTWTPRPGNQYSFVNRKSPCTAVGVRPITLIVIVMTTLKTHQSRNSTNLKRRFAVCLADRRLTLFQVKNLPSKQPGPNLNTNMFRFPLTQTIRRT